MGDCIEKVDFIVVGMGAAGAAVLRFLSDAGFSVLGIEAGGNYDKDPLIWDSVNAGDLEEMYTWKFFFQQETEPNEDVNGMTMNYTTGRMLGGGSSINGMQYVRSTDNMWSEWEKINGPDWSPAVVTKGYRALEKFYGVPNAFDPQQHGFDGKMQVRQAPIDATAMASKFAQALATATGQPLIKDYNDPNTPLGTFTRWSLFQKVNGNRASSSNDFLEDIVDSCGNSRSNKRKVKVLMNSTISKILFKTREGHRAKAKAVEIISNGQTKVLHFKKEIILCAGIHSNEILQRSGVGPADLLKELRIPVIYDNANVGAHSRNHLISNALFSADPNDAGLPADDPSALYVGGGFLPNPSGFADPKVRGFQWIGVSPQAGLLAIVFYNLKPQSEGSDRLQAYDPLKVSAVSERLLSNPQDLESIVNVYQTQILALNAEFQANYPGYALIAPSVETINDTEKLTELIKDELDHTHHWVGTCRMAPLDQGGVVNSAGKVHGVKRVRVADISVSPVQPDGNTAGPAFLVGYNIAQQIIAKYSH